MMLRAEDAQTALRALGYEADLAALDVLCRHVESEILIYCGLEELPEKLENSGYAIVYSLFIEYEGLKNEKGDVKSLTEGDLSIAYDLTGRERLVERFNATDSIRRFRKLRW